MDRCGLILLAAGASSRLGRPKQLLTYKGKSFIRNMVSVASETSCRPIIVVTGADESLIADELKDEDVTCIFNPDWTEGMASSIRTGVRTIQDNYPDCNGVLIMLTDQPFITSSIVHELLQVQQNTGHPMAACRYEHKTGTPALFHVSVFPLLLNLQGDRGAGKILQQRIDEVAIVDFPGGRIDIDTEDDYNALLKDK